MDNPVILGLHISQDLHYQEADAPEAGEEWVKVFARAKLVELAKGDGPVGAARLDAVGPLFVGRRVNEADAKGFSLLAGDYAFCQRRPIPRDLDEAVLMFCREAWWQGYDLGEKLIFRYVREDGDTALQFLI
jgi:hypothetical protein